MIKGAGVEVFNWDEQGYQPFVYFNDWQTAILNWEPIFDPQHLGEIEQHLKTDEVFVLTKGKAILFTITLQGEISVHDMVPGAIYNVKQGVWHNLISTKSAKWIIVENRDTDKTDTNIRQLLETEKAEIIKSFPLWVTEFNFD
jgi:hypothetical protein